MVLRTQPIPLLVTRREQALDGLGIDGSWIKNAEDMCFRELLTSLKEANWRQTRTKLRLLYNEQILELQAHRRQGETWQWEWVNCVQAMRDWSTAQSWPGGARKRVGRLLRLAKERFSQSQ